MQRKKIMRKNGTHMVKHRHNRKQSVAPAHMLGRFLLAVMLCVCFQLATTSSVTGREDNASANTETEQFSGKLSSSIDTLTAGILLVIVILIVLGILLYAGRKYFFPF